MAFQAGLERLLSPMAPVPAPLLGAATQNYLQLPKWDTCFCLPAVPVEENQPEHVGAGGGWAEVLAGEGEQST